jgi:hypothetical protein
MKKFIFVSYEEKVLMKNDERTERLLQNLKSNNPEVVLQTIEEIRETGSSGQITGLMELLHETDNQDIKKHILLLFSELKSTGTVPLLMEAIQNKKYADELKDLLVCCWHNGLNYNAYLPIFIDLVINEEFLTSFEAFTVIENMYGKMDETMVVQQLAKIHNSIITANEQKKYLLNELHKIILNIPEDQEKLD